MTTKEKTAALCALLGLTPQEVRALAIDRLAVRYGLDGCGVIWEAEAKRRGYRRANK
jgi:hypothetical protein